MRRESRTHGGYADGPEESALLARHWRATARTHGGLWWVWTCPNASALASPAFCKRRRSRGEQQPQKRSDKFEAARAARLTKYYLETTTLEFV